MRILNSSFHHFTETVQGFDEITYFHQGNDREETCQNNPGVSIDPCFKVHNTQQHNTNIF
ncbi:UNVERIFIED_CONTAM: hypothetical protein NCL1_57596 [Trichonephila clavipes]